jgi:hypothetical protein
MQETDFDAEYDKVMTECYRAQARHEYWFGLFNTLKQWARYENDCSLSLPQRIFYTCKAILCMVLRRQQSYWARHHITVAIFDENHVGPCGGALPEWATNWNEVVVGEGILKGWFYDIYNDSNC